MSVPASGSPGASGGDAFAAAHAALLRSGRIQTDFSQARPPIPLRLDWLGPIVRALAALGPVLKFVFWAALAVGVTLIVLYVAREALATRFPALRRRRRPSPVPTPPSPEIAIRARALLADADALAAQGRFAEAARVILQRGVEDIDARWPRRLTPGLTSRDIAVLPILPAAAQTAFAELARLVEISLFGGRDLDANDFATARQAYSGLMLGAGG